MSIIVSKKYTPCQNQILLKENDKNINVDNDNRSKNNNKRIDEECIGLYIF